MSHANNIITAPVNIMADIAYVLGSNSGDLGTLYCHPNVNMWSRMKPVPWSTSSNKVFYPQGGHSNDWFKGKDGDFGITPKSADTTNVLSFIDGDKNGWIYSRDAYTFRALDFDGYDHGAPNPFNALFMQADRDAVAPGGILTFQYQFSGSGATDHALGIVELKSGLQVAGVQKHISELYAAFLIYKKQSGGSYAFYTWCSADETLANLESDPAMHAVQYTVPNEIGDYKVVPVMTVTKKTAQMAGPDAFITIPGKTTMDFIIANNVNPYMQVTAYVYSQSSQNPNYNNTIYFYCDFFGGTNGGQFNNISLVFETANGAGLKTLNNVQNAGVAGQLTVIANSMTRKPGGGGNVYSVQWPSSSALTLENFVNSESGGFAKIFCNTAGSTLEAYRVRVFPSAAPPSGTITPF